MVSYSGSQYVCVHVSVSLVVPTNNLWLLFNWSDIQLDKLLVTKTSSQLETGSQINQGTTQQDSHSCQKYFTEKFRLQILKKRHYVMSFTMKK